MIHLHQPSYLLLHFFSQNTKLRSIFLSFFVYLCINHMLEDNKDSEQIILASLCSSPFIPHLVGLEDNKDSEKHLLATLARPSFLPISFCQMTTNIARKTCSPLILLAQQLLINEYICVAFGNSLVLVQLLVISSSYFVTYDNLNVFIVMEQLYYDSNIFNVI